MNDKQANLFKYTNEDEKKIDNLSKDLSAIIEFIKKLNELKKE